MIDILLYFIALGFMFNKTTVLNAQGQTKSIEWVLSVVKIVIWTIVWITYCRIRG